MSIPDRQLVATDDLITTRNRGARLLVFILWIALLFFFLPLIGWRIFNDWFSVGGLGLILGIAVAIITLGFSLPRFIVQVNPLRAFVTIDLLKTFLGVKTSGGREDDPKAYVAYGPGLHISFPWESRSSQSNISLEEASENFEAKIQTKVGTFTVKGSVRMRPDIRKLVPFLSGVAAIASDVTDLIKAFVVEYLGEKGTDMSEILKMLPTINKELNEKFGLGDQGKQNEDPRASDFENRFGINVGDVTIAELLPSSEVQKTLSGIAEAQLVSEGIAIVLGYKDADEMKQARESGALSQESYERGRRDFMAISENIGMNVDANEYTIRLEASDPQLVEALGRIAPGFVTLLERFQQRQGGKQQNRRTGGNPKKGA